MNESGNLSMEQSYFGKTAGGEVVDLFTLNDPDGISARITNYGGIVVSVEVPDRNGDRDDVALGFDSIEQYENYSPYFGALIGRYANRIAKGRFALDGNDYQLATNNGENHLHGGIKGFDKVVWTPRPFVDGEGAHLELSYLSADNEEGYPGSLSVKATYTLTRSSELRITYLAESDKGTIVNLTNHSYFNLSGEGNGDILQHELLINADSFTPTDAGAIPTGEIRSVDGTPFDFRDPTLIGLRIDDTDEQIRYGHGYDHNFVLNRSDAELQLAATAHDMTTGRTMEVHTTQPGLQFYSGNYLNGSFSGKRGKNYLRRSAFCLETQHFPDSPNKPQFPSTVLRPGQKYSHSTVYKFSLR